MPSCAGKLPFPSLPVVLQFPWRALCRNSEEYVSYLTSSLIFKKKKHIIYYVYNVLLASCATLLPGAELSLPAHAWPAPVKHASPQQGHRSCHVRNTLRPLTKPLGQRFVVEETCFHL